MLFVVEEASGVPNVIFETASGALSPPPARKSLCAETPHGRTVIFMTPSTVTARSGTALRCRASEGEYVDPKFIREMGEKYGAESNVFAVRVLGEFPKQSDDVLLPLHLIEDSTRRDVEAGPTTPVVWGLDVARFGSDRSALAKRQGNILVEPIKTWQNKDLMELAGIILSEYDAVPYQMRPQAIYIDAIGLRRGTG